MTINLICGGAAGECITHPQSSGLKYEQETHSLSCNDDLNVIKCNLDYSRKQEEAKKAEFSSYSTFIIISAYDPLHKLIFIWALSSTILSITLGDCVKITQEGF